jgi:hypothetical protein
MVRRQSAAQSGEISEGGGTNMHLLFNDLQSVIAFIHDESSRVHHTEAKQALDHVTDFVHQLARQRRRNPQDSN